MYIPEFFRGILVIILTEIVSYILGGGILLREDDGKKEETAQTGRKGEDDANS